VQLLEHTGRLAAFLSELEHQKQLAMIEPMTCHGEGCPKHPTQAIAPGTLVEVTRDSHGPPDSHADVGPHVSTLKKLQQRESEITKSINHLMHAVQQGDPLSGISNEEAKATESAKKADAEKHGDMEKELQVELNSAADKEDKAKIVEAAGTVAEKKIMTNMHKALAKDAAAKAAPKPQEAAVKQVEAIPMHEVVPEAPQDVHAPVNMLRDSVQNKVNQKLTKILELFAARRKAHKTLTLDEHKHVSDMLRKMSAHLMEKFAEKPTVETVRKYAPKPEPAEKPTVENDTPKPKKNPEVKKAKPAVKKAVVKKAEPPKPEPKKVEAPKAPEKKPETWAHKGMVKKEQEAMDSGDAEAPSESGSVAPGAAVKQFIWHTLGKHGAMRTETPKTLAELLKSGVRMYGGGRLSFVLKP